MFKLLEIQFIDHPVLKKLEIPFVGSDEYFVHNYRSLVIGPNGTGKSQILLAIVNIFNSLEDMIVSARRNYIFPYKYVIKYLIDSDTHTVDYSSGQLLIDDLDYRENLNLDLLPTRLILTAFNFNDKYPLKGNISSDRYHYLGLKTTNNNIFINNPSKTAIDNLYLAISNNKDVSNLGEGFKILGLRPQINVTYTKGRNFKFLLENDFWENKSLSVEEFIKKYKLYLNKKKRNPDKKEEKRFANEKIEKRLDDYGSLSIMLFYLNENIRNITNTEEKKLNYSPGINFTLKETFADFKNHVIPFQTLRDLEIIAYDGFEVFKNGDQYSFDSASSGEYHILSALINVNAYIEEGSLVLLDEPEISLHPNWQMQFMRILDKVFKSYSNTHFIISSHSHFIVSDLNKKSSNILSLTFDPVLKQIQSLPLNKDTMGWAPEAILYYIFGVANVRNHYFENDLRTALNMISNGKGDVGILQQILIRLKRFKLPDADPIKIVINDIQDFLNENSSN